MALGTRASLLSALLALASQASIAFAEAHGEGSGAEREKDKPKVKIEGRISAGFELEEFKNGRSSHDAELGFETRRKRGTRAVASMRGQSDDSAVVLEDAYIEHELEKGEDLLGGQMKKRLGLEYAQSDRERLTVRRSPLYQKLEEFAYVGREMTLRYNLDADLKAGDRGYQASLGYSESIDVNVTLHVEQPFAGGDMSAGVWALLQSDRIDAGRQFVFAAVMSLWSNHEGRRFQVELMGGVDPYMSEFARTYGDGEQVHYAGAKVQYGVSFPLSDGERIEPLVQASWIAHDVDAKGYDTLQLLLGGNYWLSEELRLALNVEGIGTNSPIDLSERAYGDSNATFEATYYF